MLGGDRGLVRVERITVSFTWYPPRRVACAFGVVGSGNIRVEHFSVPGKCAEHFMYIIDALSLFSKEKSKSQGSKASNLKPRS